MSKRMISVFLITVFLFLSVVGLFSAGAQSSAKTPQGEKMLDYLKGYSKKKLLLRDNYGYMTSVDNNNSDALFLYLLNMCDLLIHTGAKPDKNKYFDVLTNIIAAYDYDRAGDISKQMEMDNLKSLTDYAVDFAQMTADAVSVISGLSSATTQAQKGISTALDWLSVNIQNTDNQIKALSNFETIVQDYSEHYDFLDLIARKAADPDLQDAAKTLQVSMSKAFDIMLESYKDISEENFQNYSEFFFSDILFDAIKLTPEYATDESLKFFTDCGDKIVTNAFILKDSWELGVGIGKMVGNLVVGGENLINRTLEMMALHDISVILTDALIDKESSLLTDLFVTDSLDGIKSYIGLSQYLIVSRIRGEYCLYSIVAKDAGLLSWFNKESQEDAQNWYDNKVMLLSAIQQELLDILAETADFVSNKYLVEYDDVIYGVDKEGLWKNEGGYVKVPLVNCSATNLATDGQVIYYGVLADSSKASMGMYRYDMYEYDLATGTNEKILSFNECGKPICAYGDLIYYTDHTKEVANNVMLQVGRAHGLWSYNKATGERKYITDGAEIVKAYKGKIYFRDLMATITPVSLDFHQLNCYDTATGNIETISDGGVMSFEIMSDKVYYNTLKEGTDGLHAKVFSYDIESRETETLFEKTDRSIEVEAYDDKYIIYSTGRLESTVFYRYDVSSGTEDRITADDFSGNVPREVIRDKDRTVFYTDYTGGRVYTMDDGGTEIESSTGSYGWQKLLALKNDTEFAVTNDSKNYYEYYISCGRVS